MIAFTAASTTGIVLPLFDSTDSCFIEQCCFTRVQLLSQRKRWFLPSLRTSAGPAGWTVCMFSFCTFLLFHHPAFLFVYLPNESSLDVDRSHCALLSPLNLSPYCYNSDDNRAAALTHLMLVGQHECCITPCCTRRSTEWHRHDAHCDYYRISCGGRHITIVFNI